MQVATVAVVTPLAVRMKGATTDSPVQRRTVAIPGDLVVGQRVLVAVIDRQITFLGRWEAV